MAKPKEHPKPWKERRATIRQKWLVPFVALDWCCEHVSFRMGSWAFLEVLEYVAKLGLIGALAVWLWKIPERRRESEDQRKSNHYVAWQTINSAVGKPGNAGRGDALQDLNKDGVSLNGVDLSGGAVFAEPLVLTNGHLLRANFQNSSFRRLDLSGATLWEAKLNYTDCQGCNFSNSLLGFVKMTNAFFRLCNFYSTRFDSAVFAGLRFHFCNFHLSKFKVSDWNRASFSGCNFANASLLSIQNWRSTMQFSDCNIYGIKDVPEEFQEWAEKHGAVSVPITNQMEWIGWLVTNRGFRADYVEDIAKMAGMTDTMKR